MTGGQGRLRASSASQRWDAEPTRIVRHVTWLVRRTEQLAQQLEEAAAFEPPPVCEDGAPRALLVV